MFGGAKRDRTADLLNAIQALSQLSYGPDPSQAMPVTDARYVRKAPGQFKRKNAPSVVVVSADIGNVIERDIVIVVVVLKHVIP